MTATTDVAVQAKPAGVLAVTTDAHEFTAAQLEAFGIAKASRGEQMVFLHTVQRTGLDPAARQIYMIGRWDSRENRDKFTIQTGIDGYRLIADRTGLYAGSEEAWEERGGRIYSATVTIWKHVPAAGGLRPFAATAHWDEYVQTKRDGSPMGLWARMPHTMLAKCAEAKALRKAFPQDLSGIYTAEEMQQADSAAREVPTPQRAREDVQDAEVVPDEATVTFAAEVAVRAGESADVDQIRETFTTLRAAQPAVLAVDVTAHVSQAQRAAAGVTDEVVQLGTWLIACGKHVKDAGVSVAESVDLEPGADDPWALPATTPATDGADTTPAEG